MRFIKRRGDIPADSPSWIRPALPAHEVTVVAGPDGTAEGGSFNVKSGTSGENYRVTVDGECSCPGYFNRASCTHLRAVLDFAAKLLAEGN
jgi:hypothetical protein